MGIVRELREDIGYALELEPDASLLKKLVIAGITAVIITRGNRYDNRWTPGDPEGAASQGLWDHEELVAEMMLKHHPEIVELVDA